ncbi:MAG: hypothetical protein IJ568_00865 [Bacilli bacterium]|nr:hypothetical protein [Bacilli bacterium]
MNYIYDILLNFIDDNYFDFYEWKENDSFVNIKKTVVLRVKKSILDDIINYKIKLNKKIINIIKNKTTYYKKDKFNLDNICIFSNCEKSIAVSIDENGLIKYKSSLLLDEETDANKIASKQDAINIKYIKYKNQKSKLFITREELTKQEYLIKEIRKIYKSKNYNKLKYCYYELFDKEKEDYKCMYEELIKNLKNYKEKHNKIYDILRPKYKIIEK